jgi:SAM-dependent methyltransferase
MHQASITYDQLKTYYGKILSDSRDLKTSACCCTDESLPADVKAAMSEIDDEIIAKFYGCGSPIPPVLEGCTVLDLGCGTGRDVYVASKLVGENGFVIGVDMTDEQLAVARRHVEPMSRKFGYQQPNVDFRQGYIENLRTLDIDDASVDVVISNCVLNLSPDKPSVFREIFRVLKPGGELFFSDVFTGRRVPEHLTDDPVLHGECLAGAMYVEDFRRLLNGLGCPDYRMTQKRRISLGNTEIEAKIGMVDFYSMTVRAFKLNDLEDICEDYGQVAVYQGAISHHPHFFDLDDHHRFFTGKPMLVCGNTAAMVQKTRFSRHFTVTGDRSIHYGPFDCAPASVKANNPEDGGSGGACC